MVLGAGKAEITACTFSGNSAHGAGALETNATTLAIMESTFANNMSGDTGAIESQATLQMFDSTVFNNTSANAAGGLVTLTTATLDNTIITGNHDTGANSFNDITGNVTGSNNLLGVGAITGVSNGVAGNIVGPIDPKLGPLGYYGGPVQTVALLPTSPAINAGSNTLLPTDTAVDSRRQPRIVNGTVDIGAYELGNTGTITGIIYNDSNGNGVQDAGESGIGGVRVFLDYNGDGIWQSASEPRVFTAAHGTYTFTDVPAGQYYVDQQVPAGHVQTTHAGDLLVTVVAGQTANAGKFGDIAIGAGTATIAGVVFNLTFALSACCKNFSTGFPRSGAASAGRVTQTGVVETYPLELSAAKLR
jgi:hypothetical protein